MTDNSTSPAQKPTRRISAKKRGATQRGDWKRESLSEKDKAFHAAPSSKVCQLHLSPPIRLAAGHFPEGSGLRYWPIRVVRFLLCLLSFSFLRARGPSHLSDRHPTSTLTASQWYSSHTTSKGTLQMGAFFSWSWLPTPPCLLSAGEA